MLGYVKFAILAFLVLNASAAINAELRSNVAVEELLEAEIKALLAMKQVEEAMKTSSTSPLKKCFPIGQPCDPTSELLTQCCTKFCGFSAWHRGNVCLPSPID